MKLENWIKEPVCSRLRAEVCYCNSFSFVGGSTYITYAFLTALKYGTGLNAVADFLLSSLSKFPPHSKAMPKSQGASNPVYLHKQSPTQLL